VVERDGVTLREITVPVDRAGLYVPGGRAPYPSTVLMTAIPAALAGVTERVLCVPPAADGTVAASTLAAAALAGVTEVYRIAGAQAIAAMAYGTDTIRPVDVIVGPGNRYVA
jgi:histidinol dehydrogenase